MKATITLAAALVLAGGASRALAQTQLLNDGTFEKLPAGSAPDCGIPAGAWHFVDPYCEIAGQEFRIEASAVSTNGKVLVQQSGASETILLANTFTTPVQANPGHILVVEFDILVDQPTLGGGSVALFNQSMDVANQGLRMTWRANGELTVVGAGRLAYPRGVWQHLRLVLDMSVVPVPTFDLWWSLRGETPVRYAAGIPLIGGALTQLTDFMFGRFAANDVGPFLEFSSQFDNASAFEAPDANGNRIPDYEECPADYDHDGQVEPADVAEFVTAWFASLTGGTLEGDFDGNGAIEPADVAAFVVAWSAALSSGC